MEETAYAKINLALHVRTKEPDGYHSIETLFAFAEDGDLLYVRDNEALTLDVTGPFAGQLAGENLVLKAAEALRTRYDVVRGATITLDKRLPVASGIGGGSADAAAALRLLVRWWNLPFEEDVLLRIAKGLGADVPACLRSETATGTGRGDQLRIEKDSGLSGLPLLLVNPGVQVSTGAVFAAWDGVDGGPMPDSPMSGRNDLEGPACTIAPEISQVLEVLASSPGTLLSRMSGSGATCLALFERQEDRDAAAAEIGVSQPGWWLLSSRLR